MMCSDGSHYVRKVVYMNIEFPQIDYILHASSDKMTFSQREYVSLMNQCNNFFNLSFQELLDRVSREYNAKSIADILELANHVLDEENDACPNQILFDDFVRNASLVSQSLKKIIHEPSRKLVKIEKNVPANKVTHFDSKTMNWLSRRPGVTIEEKISPKNVIPTKVTFFTADTVENRHTMYLFDILYDYLFDKMYSDGDIPKCEECPYKSKKCFELYEKLQTILFLKHNVKNTDLRDVPKQKQLRQNNKLLSDKEYKQIWDAVREIDYYEQNCRSVWENLKYRYQFLSFVFVCARISSIQGVSVFDTYTQLVDHDGMIKICDDKGRDNCICFFASDENRVIEVRLNDEAINVNILEYVSSNGASWKLSKIDEIDYDLSGIFDEFDIITQRENDYNEATNALSELKKDYADVQMELQNLEAKKEIIQQLAAVLNQVKELSFDVQKEK